MPAITDYIHRLQRSSPGEITHRLRRVLLARRMKSAVRRGFPRPPSQGLLASGAADLVWPSLDFVLTIPDTPAAIPPETLNLAPAAIAAFEDHCAGLFFTDIDLAAGAPDIRQVWEPARLQHVAKMIALSRIHTDAEKRCELAKQAQSALLAWLDRHPFLFGPHYLSPMECGLRIPVFVMALTHLTTGSAEARRRLLTATYQHAWWVFRNLSLYNSLGNHTICEAVGLIFAGALFRSGGEGSRWLTRGIQLLEDELGHQILPDGGPVEQSLAYHRFVMDLYRYACDFLAVNGLYDGADVFTRLAKAETFLAAFASAGTLPAIGDSDDGWAVAPGVRPHRPNPPQPQPGAVTFPETGCTVIRTRQNVVLTFDHGPLGMPPLYNHGHADALAVTLTIAGEPFLVDPGTYRYNGQADFRRYFKSTCAHNTVTVDHQDQAVQQSGFVWRQPFRTTLTDRRSEGPSRFLIQAQHDGYTRLASSIIHQRGVQASDEDHFTIEDRFEGAGEHIFDLYFHVHPNTAVQAIDGGVQLTAAHARVTLLVNNSAGFEVIQGRSEPLLGWYSPAYGRLMASSALRCRKAGRPRDVCFETRILCETDS